MWADEVECFGRDALAPTLYDEGDSLTQWAQAALRLIGNEPCIAIGCSVGGSCALELARLAPQQVAGLVLIGAKAGVRPEPALRDRAIQCVEQHGVDEAWTAFWRPIFGPHSSAALIESAWRLARSVGRSSLIHGLRALHDRADLSTFAAEWTKPLVGISGAYDRTPTPATVESLATGPNRQFHLVPDSGHYVNLEQPEAFHSLLVASIEWITDHSATH